MNKTDVINAYSQLGIRDVTVYAMKGWDSNINPLTTITPEQGVYNLTILEEPQFRSLLGALNLADGYDNEMRNINCNIIITHQLDFCRFVGVYTYGQIPTKVHQFVTDAGVNEINKLSKLQQGRIATFYLTLRNNPLFAMVEKIIDYDGNEEVLNKIYDTYQVIDVNFDSLVAGNPLPSTPKQPEVQPQHQGEQFVSLTTENPIHAAATNLGGSVAAHSDGFDDFRAKLKQSISVKLEPMIDEIIENEINRFKAQIESNVLQQLKLN